MVFIYKQDERKNFVTPGGMNCPRCGRWVPFHTHAAELTHHVVVIEKDRVIIICPEPAPRRKHSFTIVGAIIG